MIVRDMPLESEALEQRLLHHPPRAHHRPNLLNPTRREPVISAPIKQSFSTQFVDTRGLLRADIVEEVGGNQSFYALERWIRLNCGACFWRLVEVLWKLLC